MIVVSSVSAFLCRYCGAMEKRKGNWCFFCDDGWKWKEYEWKTGFGMGIWVLSTLRRILYHLWSYERRTDIQMTRFSLRNALKIAFCSHWKWSTRIKHWFHHFASSIWFFFGWHLYTKINFNINPRKIQMMIVCAIQHEIMLPWK